MTVTESEVAAAAGAVADPEMPPVTVGDLGMVVDVRVRPSRGGARVEVDLVPTVSGCPATTIIREDVEAAVAALEGVERVAVRFVPDVVWTPERITAEGRAKLRASGIAPPGSGQTLVQLDGGPGTRCPLCGSRDSATDSPFGPTPCRAVHYCRDCRNPFEAIKP